MTSYQLIAFDTRRGNREGDESDKILGFYPTSTPTDEQSTMAGLLQGLAVFSHNFTGNASWDVTETNEALWSLIQTEANIYFGLMAAKSWIPKHVSLDSIRSLLQHTYQLTRLVHGSIELLLEQDPSGAAARSALASVLNVVGQQLSHTSAWILRELRNPFNSLDKTPTIQLPAQCATAVECCCNRILVSGIAHEEANVRHVVLLHHNLVVWSSMTPIDTAAMHSLFATTFLPGTPPLIEQKSILDNDCWEQMNNGFLIFRPNSSMEDLSIVGEFKPESLILPSLHLEDHSQGLLLPYSDGRLLALLVLDVGAATSMTDTWMKLQGVVPPAVRDLSQDLLDSKLPSVDLGHVAGYRYSHYDANALTSTPRSKISSMSHHSRALATSIRDSVTRLGNVSSNSEIWVKSSQDTMAVAAQQQLLAVKEPKAERRLLQNIQYMDAFADTMLI